MDSPTREPILVLADIIKTELELEDTVDLKGNTISPVLIYNQKYDIPTLKGLYIVLLYMGNKAIGNNNYVEDTEGGMQETQELAMTSLIQIDVMSQNTEARTRKDEVVMALRSIYAQQKMDEYGMRIASIPATWLDASDIEGTAILNRFVMTLTIFSISRKIKVLDSYYTEFKPVEVHVNE